MNDYEDFIFDLKWFAVVSEVLTQNEFDAVNAQSMFIQTILTAYPKRLPLFHRRIGSVPDRSFSESSIGTFSGRHRSESGVSPT